MGREVKDSSAGLKRLVEGASPVQNWWKRRGGLLEGL